MDSNGKLMKLTYSHKFFMKGEIMKRYFNYFKTLHDETSPVGYLGRGTHYSIVQSLAWTDLKLNPSNIPLSHNLAIIWDEDHDERIIDVIETLYIKGLLTPIIFIGERKGSLSIIVDCNIVNNIDNNDWFYEYSKTIANIADGLDDPWGSDISLSDSLTNNIINANNDSVNLYLNTLKMLWNLGLHRYPLKN